MKKLLPVVIFFLLISSGIGIFLFSSKTNLYSDDQKSAIDLLGKPSQFVISYLPREEGNQARLVRDETWYYPDESIKISFLAGDAYASEDYNPEGMVSKTDLEPGEFEFIQDYEDVAEILGKDKVYPFDYPAFYDRDNIETYASNEALFVIEKGYLTYFQTFASGNQTDTSEIPVTEIPTQNSIPAGSKRYTNTQLGFTMLVPDKWFLDSEDIVFSTYDTGYLEKGLPLPDQRSKCDFYPYREITTEITDQAVVSDSPKILKGKGIDRDTEGPGLGDNVLFVIDPEGSKPLGFLCFTYDQSFETEIIDMLKTIKLNE